MRHFVFLLFSAALAFSLSVQASEGPEGDKCESLILATGLKTANSLEVLNAKSEIYPLTALTELANLEENLAYRHPTVLMDAAQVYAMVLKRYPARKVQDPTYPIRSINHYPIFSDGVPEAGGALIIGQHAAIQEAVDFIMDKASGNRSGSSLMFVGPGGTGKTELLTILDRAADYCSLKYPEHYEYTFRWKGLEEIPYLRPLVADESGNLLISNLQRSPITLLPGDIQIRIVEALAPRIREVLGLEPSPFLTPDPQTKEIIEAIMAHYMKPGQPLTEENYLKFLSKHVEIVRRVPDLSQPPGIIRARDKHDELTTLFASQNLMNTARYTESSALAYNYSGEIARRDGRGVFFDEQYRSPEGVLNGLLDLQQNGVAASVGAPPLESNTFMLAATNDESIVDAKAKGPVGASLDRIKKVPMRQPINPTYASEIALYMQGPRSLGRRFKMRKLGEASADLEPARITELFPSPDEKGRLGSPEGRYALYYTPRPGVQVLIAPHALEMLGLTVAGTRMVTDPSRLKNYVGELNIGLESQFFVSETMRLKLLRREVRVQSAVLVDLARLNSLLKEGEGGISARDADRWLKHALSMAERMGVAVTPVIMDKAFKELLDTNQFTDNVKDRARWIDVHSAVKSDFILDELTTDVQKVLAGDAGLADRLYEEIRQELIEISSDPDAAYRYDESHEKHPIDRVRLSQIREIYKEVNGENLTPGRVTSFPVTAGGEVYEPLMRSVQKYLLNSLLSTTAINSYIDYFEGKSVPQEAQMKAQQVEIALARHGYDQSSFLQALRFVRDEKSELELRKRNSQRP